MEVITGTVDSVTYQSPDGRFAVFRMKLDGRSGACTVTGQMSAPLVGEAVEASGEWVEHARFGRQFKVESLKRVAPTSIKGIERFLASGVVKGIGPALAARMVQRFGERTLDVLMASPKKLAEVDGIGKKKAQAMHDAYSEVSEQRELMLFLEMHGVSGAYAAKIFSVYGSLSQEVLQNNPYRLAAEVDGIGFRTADQMAQAMGRPRNSDERLEAGIEYALSLVGQAGHCCIPEEMLRSECSKLLGVDSLEVGECLRRLIAEDVLCSEAWEGLTLLYPWYLYHAETRVAHRFKQLACRARAGRSANYESLVEQWEDQAGLELAEAQRQAMLASLQHGVLILTGGPGTGKTTVVRGMLEVLEKEGFKILLGAPTGRAAKRLAEATGKEASTVHRLLEASVDGSGAQVFLRDADRQLEADVVILDEVSMMDMPLTDSFLQAVPDGCRVIFVGDADQLPSVGPGAVLKDLMRSEAVPVVRLTEVYRQAQGGGIVENAHRINGGYTPDCRSSRDFQFYPCSSDEMTAQMVVRLCQEELPAQGYDMLRDIQVLSPMHRLACGVENLNKLLQQAVNPPEPGKGELTLPYQVLRLGDKVMQIRNNYEKGVFNGDIGQICELTDGKATVRYPEQKVIYEAGEGDQLLLAYAMSVHKSQGSEYPVVILPLVPGHHRMLQRNLFYTAITRAKEKVILLGSQAAINTAVGNDRTKKRYSLLAERLKGETC